MRKPRDNSAAIAAFIAQKTKIDAILARLAALSAEHFNCSPDAITWGDVGTLSRLRQVSDAAFGEGEHAV